ncbi:MAG: serine/threonine protein kinase [Xanthomonadales bacterium]|nr:serine/threonine protein kinase [Xanthomonadales bacterium]
MSADHVPNIPGYRVLSPLGRGGMASVYLAMQESVEREVALKIMAPQLSADPTFGERFLREARIAAKLHHRHVVSIFDVGVYNGFHYCTMEYLPGGPVMRRGDKPLALKPALRCIREISMALHYAQEKGFIHRDVKPDNILLREDGTCVLGDFGIARAADSGTIMTKTGSVVGTPHYMSPEQLRGRAIDGRADLYSLGVVFFQLITGKVPFEASDSLAVGIMHMTAPIPQLPSEFKILQPVLDRMLAKEPGDRYQTGGEIEAALAAIEKRLDSGDTDPSGNGESRTQPVRVARSSGYDTQGAVRTEPQIGRIDAMDEGGLRATPRPQARPRAASAPAPRRGIWWFLAALVLLAGLAYWQRPLVTAWVTEALKPAAAPTPTANPAPAVSTNPQPEPGSSGNPVASDPTPPTPDPTLPVSAVRELAEARSAEAAGRLAGADGALAAFVAAQQIDPDNPEARSAIDRIGKALAAQARTLIVANDLTAAADLQQQLAAVPALASAASELDQAIAEARKRQQRGAQIPALLAEAEDLAGKKRWIEPRGNSAADRYRAVLALEPGNREATAGLDSAVRAGVAQAELAIETGQLDRANDLLKRMQTLAPRSRSLTDLRERLEDAQARARGPSPEQLARHDQFIREGRQALANDQLLEPPGDSAYDKFRNAMNVDPRSADAKAGMEAIGQKLRERIDRNLAQGRATYADADISALNAVDPRYSGMSELKRRVAETYASNGLRSLERGSAEQAREDLKNAEKLDASAPAVNQLRAALGGG